MIRSTALLFALYGIFIIPGFSQFGPQNIVTNNATNALDVFSIDLNGDGNVDLISASSFDNKVAWYQNLGNGVFSSQQVISNTANAVNRVHAGDLTADGQPDIVAGIAGGLIWYENLGNGSFGPGSFINNLSLSSASVFVADVDNDTLNDIVVGIGGTVLYHRNLGNGSFGLQQTISTNYTFIQRIYMDDIDGDNLIDLLVASLTDDKIGLHKNLGSGSFSNQILISSNVDGAIGVYASDLDGDGDLDVIGVGANNDRLSWFLNDGNGNFGAENFVDDNLDFPSSVYASDVDQDGDMDLLYTSQLNGQLGYFENQGGAVFNNSRILISGGFNNPRVVIADDLDNDLDQDVILASRSDNRIAWFRNLSAVCPAPSNLQIANLNSVRATLLWDSGTGPGQFQVIGGIVGSSTVYTVEAGSNVQLGIDNLNPETSYWWRVQSTCPDASTGLSEIDTFATPQFCASPSLFFTTIIFGTSSVSLNWTPASNAIGYFIAGRKSGAPQPVILYVPGGNSSSIIINNLQLCTDYEWRMIADCGYEVSPINPIVSPVLSFTTDGCSNSTKSDASVYPMSTKLYPNPTSGRTTIVHPSNILEVVVTDASGKEMLQMSNIGDKMLRLDLGHLSGGIYHVTIRSESQVTVEKLWILPRE